LGQKNPYLATAGTGQADQVAGLWLVIDDGVISVWSKRCNRKGAAGLERGA
jgi:hypothetical protein